MLSQNTIALKSNSLITKFTDIKSVVHKVKHSIVVTTDIKELQDRIIEDLYRVFTQKAVE